MGGKNVDMDGENVESNIGWKKQRDPNLLRTSEKYYFKNTTFKASISQKWSD